MTNTSDNTSDKRISESDQALALWYRSGLRFTCTGCGACCTGTGRVWLSEEEVIEMAERLDIVVDEFVSQSVDREAGRWALREDPQTGDCTFLQGGRCTAYKARPRQCRTFPWWPSTLESQATWAEAKRVCEGIDHSESTLVPLSEIQSELRQERLGRAKWGRS